MSNERDPHSAGEKDFTKGKYNPPHSITPLDQAVHSKNTLDKMQKDNDQYDSGYKNARKQK